MAVLELGVLLTFYAIVEFSASFIVWSISSKAEFLKGKLIWSNWDAEQWKAKKELSETTPELIIGLIGWGV